MGKRSVAVEVTSRQRAVLEPLARAKVAPQRSRVLEFIAYFNKVLAKPFRWTYTGRPLQA